jgi:hypothetical protein
MVVDRRLSSTDDLRRRQHHHLVHNLPLASSGRKRRRLFRLPEAKWTNVTVIPTATTRYLPVLCYRYVVRELGGTWQGFGEDPALVVRARDAIDSRNGHVRKGQCGVISGNIQTATGAGVTNGTLGFTLSQSAVLAGTATIVTQTSNC